MKLQSQDVLPVMVGGLSSPWNLRKPVLLSILVVGLVLALAAPVPATEAFAAQAASPAASQFSRIGELIEKAIREKKLPGAVILVGQQDRIHYRKGFGNRAVVPSIEPMTVDTVFDLGSLTKVVATTPSVMLLVQKGRISLNTPVA